MSTNESDNPRKSSAGAPHHLITAAPAFFRIADVMRITAFDGRALSVKRFSRDDSQPDFGLDAGKPVLAVLKSERIKIDTAYPRLSGQILQRGHAVEPAQSVRGNQGSLVSRRDHNDL